MKFCQWWPLGRFTATNIVFTVSVHSFSVCLDNNSSIGPIDFTAHWLQLLNVECVCVPSATATTKPKQRKQIKLGKGKSKQRRKVCGSDKCTLSQGIGPTVRPAPIAIAAKSAICRRSPNASQLPISLCLTLYFYTHATQSIVEGNNSKLNLIGFDRISINCWQLQTVTRQCELDCKRRKRK